MRLRKILWHWLPGLIPVSPWRRRVRDRLRVRGLLRAERTLQPLDPDRLDLDADQRARLARFRELAADHLRVVIWGFHTRFHTHRYIHSAYYATLRRLGVPVVWLENTRANADRLRPDDLVITATYVGEPRFGGLFLPFRRDVSYVLHEAGGQTFATGDADPRRVLQLKEYRRQFDEATSADAERFEAVTVFDPATRTLIQPWGTDLLPWEFRPPVFTDTDRVFWVGTVWRGNREMIDELRAALAAHRLRLVPVSEVSADDAIRYVRESRLAPAFAGEGHVQTDYLPCRVFKNISYGQLALTNVPRFRDLLGDAAVPGRTVAEQVDAALSLSRDEYLDRIARQQARIGRHTYLDKFIHIFEALRRIRRGG